MPKTVVVHNRYAWRSYRTKAAFDSEQGLRLLTIEQLAARLAGGFLTPIDSDQLKSTVASAIKERLGELDAIKQLPGFQRAAAASLSKAWSAGLTLEKEAARAADQTARERLFSLAALEAGSTFSPAVQSDSAQRLGSGSIEMCTACARNLRPC